MYVPANLILLLVFCTYQLTAAKKKTKVRTTAIIDSVGTCIDSADMFINYTYAGKDNFRVNAEFNSAEPVDDVNFHNSFERCESATAVQCEPFMDVPMDDWCTFLTKKLTGVWKILLSTWEPPLACPFQGKYKLTNMGLTELVESLVKIGSLDVKNDRYYYRWSMRATAKTSNKELLCIWIIAALKQYREVVQE